MTYTSRRKRLITLLGSVSLLAYASCGHSALITQIGSDIAFTYDDSSILGAGVVVDNRLSFVPTTLSATSSGLNQFDSNRSNLSIRISSLNPNYLFDQLSITQSGNYNSLGSGSVSVRSELDIDTNLDGITNLSTSIVPNQPLSSTNGLFSNWNAQTTQSLTSFQSNAIELDLSSFLSAETGSSFGFAFISQTLNQLDISIDLDSPTASVSEPSTAIILMIGLMGLASVKRQRPCSEITKSQ